MEGEVERSEAENESGALLKEFSGILDKYKPKQEEAPKEEVSEEVQGEATEKEVEEEPAFDMSSFNKATGSKYKDLDEYKNSSTEREAKFKELEEEKTRVLGDYQKLRDFTSTLGSNEDIKNFLITKKFKDTVSPEVAGRVLSMDVGNTNPLDAIILAERLKNKNLRGGDEGVRKGIITDLDLSSTDMNSLTDEEYNKLERKAFSARQELRDFQNTNIDTGEITPLDKVLEEKSLKENENKTNIEAAYQNVSNTVSKEVNSIKIKVGDRETDYELGDDDKKRLSELMTNEFSYYARNGDKPDKKNVGESLERAITRLKGERMESILNYVSKEVKEEVVNQKEDEYYNARKANYGETSPSNRKETATERSARIKRNMEGAVFGADAPMGYN